MPLNTPNDLPDRPVIVAPPILLCPLGGRGDLAGKGNLDSDALFVDAGNGDYRLRSDSPCRDAGSNAHLPPDFADLSNDGNSTETLPRDIILRGRIEGTSVDMGAFEWHP